MLFIEVVFSLHLFFPKQVGKAFVGKIQMRQTRCVWVKHGHKPFIDKPGNQIDVRVVVCVASCSEQGPTSHGVADTTLQAGQVFRSSQ